MKRLFLALWPDSKVRRNLLVVRQALKRQHGRLVAESNLHVTLVFLGSVTESKFLDIVQQINTLSEFSFTITFDQLSYWQKPKILCLTCTETPTEILALVESLNCVTNALDIITDQTRFQPHITIVRHALEQANVDIEPVVLQVSRFSLIESTSTASGVRYEVLTDWPLLSR